MYIVPTSESFKWEKYNLINPDTVKFVTYNGTVYYNKYLGLMQITLALQDNSHHGADYYIIGRWDMYIHQWSSNSNVSGNYGKRGFASSHSCR